jgi:hypothetical protein
MHTNGWKTVYADKQAVVLTRSATGR